ncbi:MAG: hypothetical protein CSB33_00975 [Desulfobacterales bacterium]|nr:MAG: hypothetical protein CSB33_00975 [Desulfobacterales bacterium]
MRTNKIMAAAAVFRRERLWSKDGLIPEYWPRPASCNAFAQRFLRKMKIIFKYLKLLFHRGYVNS